MSYRCSLCHDDVPHGQAMLRHIIYRDQPRTGVASKPNPQRPMTRQEIARELPVCVRCKELLDSGMPLANLLTLVKTESQWKVKKAKLKVAPVGRLATEREIAKLKAQIAALSGGAK